MPSIWNYSCHTEQNKDTSSKQDTIASSKLIVTGILTHPAGNPVIDSDVMLMFGEGVLKIGEEGIVINPGSNTDENGRFILEIEIDSLKEFDYSFMIRVSRGTNSYYLMDENEIPIIVKVDPKTRQFDMGTVLLK